MDPLLVLDFDGVLSDSIHDSFRTSLNAYQDGRPGHGLPLSGPLESGRVFDFERGHPGLFRAFRRLIPLGNRAEEYFVIWRILDSPDRDRDFDQAAFDRAKASVPDMERKAYADRFYALRSGEQDADPEAWAILLPPFGGLPEAVRGLAARFRMAIATSKDLRSVRLLLSRYGIENCFARDAVLDKNFSYSKRDHLDHFRRTFGIPFERMHFVDDKLLHLTAVRDMGVRCYLAEWGFNTERERREAREAGFGVLSVRGFEALEP